MKTWLMVAALAVASIGIAEDTAVYRTKGKSHYLNGEFTLKQWGLERLKMTAKLVQGDNVHDVETWFDVPGSGTIYKGYGTITVKFKNGKGCKHRFGANLHMGSEPDTFYLEENTPKSISVHSCQPAGPYVWFHHEEPYVKVP